MIMRSTEVAEGIYEIEPAAGSAVSCSCYLVSAAVPAIVETGPACQVPGILEAVAGLGRTPSYVILSHAHVDHAGGVGRLLSALPGVTLVAHEEAVRPLVDPRRLVEGINQVFGADFEEVYGPVLPVPTERIRPVGDGDVVSLGDRELRVIHTPGHVAHHISLFDPLTQSLFLGDALGARNIAGAEIIPNAAPPGYDVALAVESAEKLAQLQPRLPFFAHYGTAYDAERLIELFPVVTRGCADAVLRAARAGEPAAQIEERLLGYLHIAGSGRPWIDALLVPGFLHYFRQKGLI